MSTIDKPSPPNREATLIVAATPDQLNLGGTIFGGWIMGQMDIAGSIPALKRAQGPVMTVAVNQIQFVAPVLAGDLVYLYADLVHSGKTSLQVEVQVWSMRNAANPVRVLTATGQLVYVAVNSEGRSRTLPPE